MVKSRALVLIHFIHTFNQFLMLMPSRKARLLKPNFQQKMKLGGS
jgi:hypothetical protein